MMLPENTPSPVDPSVPADSTALADPFLDQIDRIKARRVAFQHRHAHGLTSLMATREDLRGVHALADLVDDGVRWTA